MKSRNLTLILLVLLASSLLMVGCAKTAKNAKSKKKPPKVKAVGHSLPERVRLKLEKDLRFDFKIISETRDDTSQLSLALTKGALTRLSQKISDELQKNQIKIRGFNNLKIAVKNYNKPFVGVMVLYRDTSYFISSDTSQALTSPTNENKSLILSVVKKDGRWKIAEFLGPAQPEDKSKSK